MYCVLQCKSALEKVEGSRTNRHSSSISAAALNTAQFCTCIACTSANPLHIPDVKFHKLTMLRCPYPIPDISIFRGLDQASELTTEPTQYVGQITLTILMIDSERSCGLEFNLAICKYSDSPHQCLKRSSKKLSRAVYKDARQPFLFHITLLPLHPPPLSIFLLQTRGRYPPLSSRAMLSVFAYTAVVP